MKIKLSKEARKALGVKKKYVDVEDVFELLWKVVKRWLKGTVKKKRPSFSTSKATPKRYIQPQVVVQTRAATKPPVVQQSAVQEQLDQAVQYGRLLEEANEEVHALHDYLDALQELKANG